MQAEYKETPIDARKQIDFIGGVIREGLNVNIGNNLHDTKYVCKVYILTPVWIQAIPPHWSVQAPPSTSLPVANPASLIMLANSG